MSLAQLFVLDLVAVVVLVFAIYFRGTDGGT